MLFYGYKTGILITSVYSDAAICLASWATKEDGITLHCLSTGWGVAMKTILSHTNHADLSLIVDSFMDTSMGPLEEVATYRKVLGRLALPPEDVLLLTHSAVKGLAAHQAGLGVVLVATHREDELRESETLKQSLHHHPCKSSLTSGLPFIRIFTELAFTVDAPLASSLVDQTEVNRSIAADKSAQSALVGPPSTSSYPSLRKDNSPNSLSKTKTGNNSYSSIKKNIKTVVKSCSQKFNQTPRSKSSKGRKGKGGGKSGKSAKESPTPTTKLIENLLTKTKTSTKLGSNLTLTSKNKSKSISTPSKIKLIVKSVKQATPSHLSQVPKKSNSKKSHS